MGLLEAIASKEGLLTWTGQQQHPATIPCDCRWIDLQSWAGLKASS